MTMKTADLTGPALDWAVASIEGYTNLRFRREPPLIGAWIMDPPRKMYGPVLLADISASTDWSQGGPIIEREKITIECHGAEWLAFKLGVDYYAENTPDEFPNGPTPLIAAMRCYVASKLGDEIDVPKELLA